MGEEKEAWEAGRVKRHSTSPQRLSFTAQSSPDCLKILLSFSHSERLYALSFCLCSREHLHGHWATGIWRPVCAEVQPSVQDVEKNEVLRCINGREIAEQ